MATAIATTNEQKSDPLVKVIQSTRVDGVAPRSMFLPASMGEAMEIAKLMAGSNFVAPHLRGKAGDCLAVVMQAGRWGMDPYAVANKTFFVNDRIAYEAQLVNAVVNSSRVLDGRLQVEWAGEGNDLVCTATGKVKGDSTVKKRRVPIKNITTRNSPLWKQDPEQQLAYYATRAWARLHTPEVLMGVYTPDELSQALSTHGSGDLAHEIKPLTAAMLEHQAAGDNASPATADPETGEIIEGRAEADHGEAVTLESAKAEIDAADTVIDVNSRRAALVEHLTGDDVDEFNLHAMARIEALKA